MLKLYIHICLFLHTIFHNSDMYFSIFIIFRDLMNIGKALLVSSKSLKMINYRSKHVGVMTNSV